MNPQLPKLEALLARVQKRALEPRVLHHAEQSTETVAPPSLQTVPPSPDARAAIAHEITAATPVPAAAAAPEPVTPEPILVTEATPSPVVAQAAESRSQLVAHAPADPVDELLELDDSHVVNEEGDGSIDVIEEEEAPPSSRRPKPLEEVAAEQPVAHTHTPPPESGRQVAAAPTKDELNFEDDLSGVRESFVPPPPAPVPEPEGIALGVSAPQAAPKRHSMEMEIPMLGAPGAFSPDLAPPPQPATPAPAPVAAAPAVPAPAVSEVQVVRAELREAEVAEVRGAVPASFEPKTFGELLDAALSL